MSICLMSKSLLNRLIEVITCLLTKNRKLGLPELDYFWILFSSFRITEPWKIPRKNLWDIFECQLFTQNNNFERTVDMFSLKWIHITNSPRQLFWMCAFAIWMNLERKLRALFWYWKCEFGIVFIACNKTSPEEPK